MPQLDSTRTTTTKRWSGLGWYDSSPGYRRLARRIGEVRRLRKADADQDRLGASRWADDGGSEGPPPRAEVRA
jgi:hypothetical protein